MLSIIPSDPIPYFRPSDERDERSGGPRRSDDMEDGFSDDSVDEDLGIGPSKLIATPGEIITTSTEFMRGHGTYIRTATAALEEDGVQEGDGLVISSVAGTIERVNKLVSVKPVHTRYAPDNGDLVIGRVTEVVQARWKVDVNARQDARLDLTSVNLPGGVQRRRVEQDALKMREFLAEGDLLVAEVREVYQDGTANLHTRSLRYGKLRNGLLISVAPHLIRRLKSHFYSLPPPCGPHGVDVILGLNGYIWVAVSLGEDRQVGGQGFDEEGVYSDKNDVRLLLFKTIRQSADEDRALTNACDLMQEISPESREAISLVARLILIFAKHSIPLSDNLIMEAYVWCRENLDTESDEAVDTEINASQERAMLFTVAGTDIAARS